MKLSSSKRKITTMKEVALLAGVHQTSVSVVLNGSRSSAGISGATRQRILDAAEELGYRRNGSAYTVRTGRFGSVALLLSAKRGHSYLPPTLLAGLQESLARQDMTLIVCHVPDETLSDSGALPKILRERTCDGLIIDYNKDIPAPMIESIERHRIPAVWINSQQPADCVYPDDFEAGKEATRYLINLGHRRIAYADFATPVADDPTQHYSRKERREGYKAMMREHGLENLVWGGKDFYHDQIEEGRRLLSASESPTALIGYADWAMQGLSYAAAALGRQVPRDLSVVSFGPEQVDYMCRPLTMLIEPQEEIAQCATRMICEKIENPALALAPQAITFTLQEGCSTENTQEIASRHEEVKLP